MWVRMLRNVRGEDETGWEAGTTHEASKSFGRYLVGVGKAVEVDGPDAEEAEEDRDADAIPHDFPGSEALEAAGVTTLEALAAVDDLTAIEGIGRATAARIEEALAGG